MKKSLFVILALSVLMPSLSFATDSITKCRNLSLICKTVFELRKNSISPEKACIITGEKIFGSTLPEEVCEVVNDSLDIIMDVADSTTPEEVEKAIFSSCTSKEDEKEKKALPKSKDDSWNLLKKLANKMYVIGETTGKIESFRSEETIIAYRMSELGESNPESLIQENELGQTPLMIASDLGYAKVVSKMLQVPIVVKNINKKDKRGMTALDYARFAKHQAIWVCNSLVFENPFVFVPYYVTKEYYDIESPYQKISRELKEAGANSKEETSKELWLGFCSNATEASKSRIKQSKDVLSEILKLGNEVYKDYINRQKNK